MISDEDQVAQAWGFKDAQELMGRHAQAFPGYAEARRQADEQMAELQVSILRRVDEINKKLPDGVKFVVESAVRETEEKSDGQEEVHS